MQQQGCVECHWPFVVMADVHHNFDLLSAAGAQNLLFEMSFDCFSGSSKLAFNMFCCFDCSILAMLF